MEAKPNIAAFAAGLLLALGLACAPRTSHAFEWRTDLPQALADAHQGQKFILLYFSGSDWCVWCKQLDAEVFSTAAFRTYADTQIVPVLVDFPSQTQMPPDVQARNESLAMQFQISGFPALLLFSPAGELLVQLGYQPGGPDAYLPVFRQAQARWLMRNPRPPP